MKYFEYENGEFKLTKTRPGNQNLPPVQQKIADRLKAMIDENQNLEMTDLQQKFVEEVEEEGKSSLKANKIDICHHIAISAIMNFILERMNNPKKGNDKAAKELAETIISSDSPESIRKVKEFFDLLQDDNIDAEEKINVANEVVERLNRATPNLLPGHASTNRSIGKNKDPHLVIKNDEYVQTKRSSKIGNSFDAAIDDIYESKKNSDGEEQSSSYNKKPSKAYGSFSIWDESSEETPTPKSTEISSEVTESSESRVESSSASRESSESKSENATNTENSESNTESDDSYYSPSYK